MDKHSAGDWGETELDAQEQRNAEVNLDDPEASDDEPWSPPDRQPRGAELAEVDDETLSVRLMQEEPDPNAVAGLEEPTVGGDDPDAIPAREDLVRGDAFDPDDSVDLEGESGPEAGAMHLE